MPHSLPDDLEALIQKRAGGSALVLLFDCDGTLVPFAASPSVSELPPRTRVTLSELAARPRVSVGIISSRDLADLKRVIGLDGLHYSGAGGLEFDFRGVPMAHPRADELSPRMAEVAGVLEEAIAGSAGARVERKRLGATVHYRSVAGPEIDGLKGKVSAALEPFAGELRVLDSAMAIEITPRTVWNKGFAVREIYRRAGAGGGLLYAGDEEGDTDAVEATRALDGVPIGIGPRAPLLAAHRLPSTGALADLIAGLLTRIDAPARASR
jgi:trehalose 6-phosphate phosphatase